MRQASITLLLLLVGAACAGQIRSAEAASKPAANPLNSVPEARFNHLRRGINLSHWFAQSLTGNYEPQHLTTYVTARDFDLIKSMGFDHVRLTIEPAPLFNPAQPDKLEPEHLKLLKGAVEIALGRGLAVILDVHPSSDFKHKLQTEDGQVESFADFWHTLAAHFARTDPERVFFEVLNEPEMSDGYRWYGIQARMIAAIRSAAPQHTIVASGHGWSVIDDLVALEPFADHNVIYNFHYYQPSTFTHQGANWGLELWRHLPGGVHYPSQPGADSALIAALPLFTQKLQLVRYDQDRWDRQRIESEIAVAGEWAAEHHVRLTCNEFGVYRQYADPQERAAWIRDVRTALETHGIGWTMWDYAGNFAVAPGEPGQRAADESVLRALGLK